MKGPWAVLEGKGEALLKRWLGLVVEGYPEPFGRFLQEESDPFSNPVGQTFRRAMEEVWEMVLRGEGEGEALKEAMKLRAVQGFAPSEAVGFVFLLKEALKQELKGVSPEYWKELDRRIDHIALKAFDLYMEAREAVHRLRRRELEAQRDMAFRALARAEGV